MARPRKQQYGDLGLNDADLGAIVRRIHAAVGWHDNKYQGRAKELLEYYIGDQWKRAGVTDGDHMATVNRILPNIELKVNNIAYKRPEFLVRPRTMAAEEAGKLGKALLTYFWDEEDMGRQTKKALLDCKVLRFGAVYIGWRWETGDTILENDRKPTEGDLPPSPEAMAETAMEGQDPLSVTPKAQVLKDAPCVRRVKPTDLMVEPGSDYCIEDARFIVWRETLPLDEVKANPAYQNTKDLKGKKLYDESLLPEAIKNLDEEQRPDDVKCVTLLHYYEKRRRLHCVYSDEQWDKELLVEKWPWPFSDYPFEAIVAHEVNDRAPAECPSDVDLVQDIQDIVNQTRSRQVSHVAQFNEKYQVRSGTLSPSARRQLRSDRRGIAVEHNGATDQAIFPLAPPQIQPEVYQVEERSLREIDVQLGVSDYQRNSLPTGGRRTATEVVNLQQSGAGRAQADVVAYSVFVRNVARKVLQLLRKYAVATVSLPITDEVTNVQAFVNVTIEAIQGEYDLDVEIGSTEAVNPEAEKQNAIFLLQTLTPYAQMVTQQVDPATGQVVQVPVVNIVPLLREIVKQSGIKGADQIIAPPAPPQPVAPPIPADPGAPAAPPPPVGQDPLAQLAGAMSGAGSY